MAIIYQFQSDPKHRHPVDGDQDSLCYCEKEGRYLKEWELELATTAFIERCFQVLEDA